MPICLDLEAEGGVVTKNSRPMCLALIFCVIIIIGLLSAIIYLLVIREKVPCMTRECIALSAELNAQMDFDVDPCDNFYDYVCGNWLSTVTVPEGSAYWYSFSPLEDKNAQILIEMLQEPGNIYIGVNSSSIETAKNFYRSCVNKTLIDALGPEPMLQYVDEIGSCPLLDGVAGNWRPAQWKLERNLVEAHRRSDNPIWWWGVYSDLVSDYNMFWFGQGSLQMGARSIYLGDDAEYYQQIYVTYMTQLLTLMGAIGDVQQQVEQDWQFQTELAQISEPDDDIMSLAEMYHKMTVAEFQQLLGDWFDLSEYLELLVGEPVALTDEVVVTTPDYFRRLGDLMTRTDDGVIANYIAMFVIKLNVRYLASDLVDVNEEFRGQLTGDRTGAEPEEDCLYTLQGFMPDITGALFVQAVFGDSPFKEDIGEQLDNIVAAFKTRLDALDWMDDSTRMVAYQKVDLMTRQIGYDDIIKQPDQLDERYEKYNFTERFFDNIMRGFITDSENNIRKLGTTEPETQWMAANEVNAYYDSTLNDMVLLAGILQPPFYAPGFPGAMKYGGIGSVIGHELSHGFDYGGREFDQYGKLVDWWSNSSEAAFLERTECMIEQYDAFQVGDSFVNGRMTLSENIADNGGLLMAWDAYLNWRRKYPDDEANMAGLSLTPDQLFFVGYALSYCTYETPEHAERRILTDEHANNIYRVIGVLQNTRPFAEAFSCPLGSPMHPEKKCVIW